MMKGPIYLGPGARSAAGLPPALVLALLALLLAAPDPASADTPANCSYEEIRGSWTFSVGSQDHDGTVNCTENFGGLHGRF